MPKWFSAVLSKSMTTAIQPARVMYFIMIVEF